MKKEESVKLMTGKDLKNHHDHRSRSHSPKGYIGCDTCKLKNTELLKKNKSLSKFSENNLNTDKNRVNKFRKLTNSSEREDSKREKVKLTDLCDDDKKRIVELIEELSKFAEKNQKLKEMLDHMQKTKQDQQDYMMKQANLHLEEKNFYVNEINEYKSRIELLETEMRNKVLHWEKQEKVMDTEISYLAKALQESVNEKNDLNDQMNHLRICLRQSLESFQRLRDDIAVLQHQERLIKKFKSASSQTEARFFAPKEKSLSEDMEFDEELYSLSAHNSVDGKSSLDVINDKLEQFYQLLKRKSETIGKSNSQKYNIDLSILLRNDNLREEEKNLINDIQDDLLNSDEMERNSTDSGYKFLKPFDYCSKTSIQAERILKKIGKPLKVNGKRSPGTSPRDFRSVELGKYLKKSHPNKRPIQENDFFRSDEDVRQCNEDRLLEDLFYPDGNLKLMEPESQLHENGGKIQKKFSTCFSTSPSSLIQ